MRVPHCLSIKHLLLILSLLITSAADIASAAGAPLCSQVLITHSDLSLSATNLTIQKLAELKLEVDHVKPDGAPTPFETVREKEYHSRLAALIESLQGTMSAEVVKEKITEHIRILQAREIERNKTETISRETERDLVKGYQFHRQIDVDADGLPSNLSYIAKKDAVIFRDSKNRKLKILNLANDQTDTLQKDIAKYFVIKNGEALLTISDTGRMTEINLATAEPRALKGVQVETHQIQDLSPNEKLFATADNGSNRLLLVDIQTGNYSVNQIKLPEPHRALSTVKFLNDNEILVVRFMENFMHKINLTTGQSEIIQTTNNAITNIIVSPNGEQTILRSPKGLIALPTKDIKNYDNYTHQEVGKSVMNLQFFPDGKKVLVLYRDDSSLQRAIFNAEVYKDALFTFPQSLNAVEPQNIAMPAYNSQSQRFLFSNAYKNPDGVKQYTIEIYKQEQ